MINTADKIKCCGCRACVVICPKRCISMHEDSEGFLYPSIFLPDCINCGKCERVCPCLVDTASDKLTKNSEANPPAFVAINADDEIRHISSSAGIFGIFAEEALNEGGVVFGARWDEKWEVCHDYIEKIEDIKLLRGTKYLQSDAKNAYTDARELLCSGRKVLFTGLPCQIAGLKLFLGREFENLTTLDILCGSVPSPKAWRVFLNAILKGRPLNSLKSINFRKKAAPRYGTKTSLFFSVEDKCNAAPAYEGHFYGTSFGRGFHKRLTVRPSCFLCPAANLNSGSDIMIGDFWGVEKIRPEISADDGVSVLICKTEKGEKLLKKLAPKFASLEKTAFEYARDNNGGLQWDRKPSAEREAYVRDFSAAKTDREAFKVLKKYTDPPLRSRITGFIVYKIMAPLGLLGFCQRIIAFIKK